VRCVAPGYCWSCAWLLLVLCYAGGHITHAMLVLVFAFVVVVGFGCRFLIEFGVVSSAMWTACLAHELSRVRGVAYHASVAGRNCHYPCCCCCWLLGPIARMSQFITRLNEEVHGNFAMRRYRIYLCLSWGLALVLALIGGIVGDFASAGSSQTAMSFALSKPMFCATSITSIGVMLQEGGAGSRTASTWCNFCWAMCRCSVS